MRCLEWCEAVDVDAEEFVAYLCEHGVVELEERQLHARLWCGGRSHVGGRGGAVSARCGLLEALQHGVGAVGDAARHAGEACHVDAEAVFRAAAGELDRKSVV